MDDDSRNGMSDKQMAFHLLAALTKSKGGRLVVKDSELDSVDVADTLLFYFDKETRDIILTITTMEPDTEIDN
jgi:hypothetical protein